MKVRCGQPGDIVSDTFIENTSNIVSSETGFIREICLVENIHHSKLKATLQYDGQLV